MDGIEIIIPKGADESRLLDFCLINLTRAIDQFDSGKVAHGFLGGEHGYGADWDNDVFTMRPYYWGDCDCGWSELEWKWSEENKHSSACYRAAYKAIPYDWLKQKKQHEAAVRALCEKHGIPYNKGIGSAVHCTCAYERQWKEFYAQHGGHKNTCSLELPNFRHKASGFEVRWYKYIGRDMEAKNPNNADVAAIFRECMKSLPNG